MVPVTQTKFAIKNSQGEYVSRGNCLAAVVASILELPITEVPNIEVLYDIGDDSLWSITLHAWLKSKGWELMTDDRYSCFHPKQVDLSLSEERLIEICNELKDDYYLVSGAAARGVRHICIYKSGELIWDPYPTREGLLTTDAFQTLEKI